MITLQKLFTTGHIVGLQYLAQQAVGKVISQLEVPIIRHSTAPMGEKIIRNL